MAGDADLAATLNAVVQRVQAIERRRDKLIGGKVYRNIDHVITAATATAVVFTTREDENPAGLVWDSGTALYCPVGAAGRYLVIGRVRWTQAPVSPVVAVVKNGTTPVARTSHNLGSAVVAGHTMEAVGTATMTDNDLIQLVVQYNSGTGTVEGQAGTTLAPRSPTLEMWRIGS